MGSLLLQLEEDNLSPSDPFLTAALITITPVTMCTLGTKLLRMVKLYHYNIFDINIYEHNVYRSTMSQTIVILEFVHCKRSDLRVIS